MTVIVDKVTSMWSTDLLDFCKEEEMENARKKLESLDDDLQKIVESAISILKISKV